MLAKSECRIKSSFDTHRLSLFRKPVQVYTCTHAAKSAHLTLMTTSAQVVETSVNVTTKSRSQDYTHPGDHNLPTYEIFRYREGVHQIYEIIILFILRCKYRIISLGFLGTLYCKL